MEPIVHKYRVLLECKSTGCKSSHWKLRTNKVASCEPINEQVIKLTVSEAAS